MKLVTSVEYHSPGPYSTATTESADDHVPENDSSGFLWYGSMPVVTVLHQRTAPSQGKRGLHISKFPPATDSRLQLPNRLGVVEIPQEKSRWCTTNQRTTPSDDLERVATDFVACVKQAVLPSDVDLTSFQEK